MSNIRTKLAVLNNGKAVIYDCEEATSGPWINPSWINPLYVEIKDKGIQFTPLAMLILPGKDARVFFNEKKYVMYSYTPDEDIMNLRNQYIAKAAAQFSEVMAMQNKSSESTPEG